MKKSDLLDVLKDIDDNADLVISKCFIIDERDKVTAILDIPIVGIAHNKDGEEQELRFMLNFDDVSKTFRPKDFIPLKIS